MNRAVTAFLRALASQLHPKMLALLLVPFAVAIVLWVVVAWAVWDPLVDWLRVQFFEGGGVANWIYGQAERFGLEGLRDVVTAAVALMLVVPLMFVTALLIIALFSMPAVNRHLGGGPYRDVERRGSWSVVASLWNALWATLVFLAGYLVTLPLWLIPPLGFIVPWLWWGWLTARLMRFDSLVEHADPAERRALIGRHRRETFLLAGMLTVLNYIPPLFLLTPVLSALAFVHFSLAALRADRGSGPVRQ
jgi:uncharacterized protein involved in cysteine biosynthesis